MKRSRDLSHDFFRSQQRHADSETIKSSTSEPHWLLERLMSALETELYEKTVELERRELEDEGDGEKDEGMPRKEATPPQLAVRTSPLEMREYSAGEQA